MTQRVDPKLPLLEKMRLLTPSPDNQTCECAGNYQCAACIIKEAREEINDLLNLIEGLEDRIGDYQNAALQRDILS